MYILKKIFRVPIGHRLSKHEGLCKFVHGHNLKIEIEICSEVLNKNDMVIDFSDVKNIVNDVLASWDHALFLNIFDKSIRDTSDRTLTVSGDPTAELLSKKLYDILKEDFEKSGIDLVSVTIWESDDACVSYREMKYE